MIIRAFTSNFANTGSLVMLCLGLIGAGCSKQSIESKLSSVALPAGSLKVIDRELEKTDAALPAIAVTSMPVPMGQKEIDNVPILSPLLMALANDAITLRKAIETKDYLTAWKALNTSEEALRGLLKKSENLRRPLPGDPINGVMSAISTIRGELRKASEL